MKIYNYTSNGHIELVDVGSWEQLDELDQLRTTLQYNSNRLTWLFYLMPVYDTNSTFKAESQPLNVMKIDIEILLKIKNLIMRYERV